MLDTLKILTLLSTPGIGRGTVQQIIEVLKPSTAGSDPLSDLLIHAKAQAPRIKVPPQHELAKAFDKAQRILDQADSAQIKVIGFYDQHFPKQLRAIPDPPVLLYVKGDQDVLGQGPSVAIIGTREPTEYGSKMAKRCGTMFSEKGFVVVSGLALGCDAAAHSGMTAVHGRGIAVLAHGLDMIYPAKHKGLAEEILACGGCLVSEYAPHERPRRNYFVERDRLQSGLSGGVVVIETDISGGTMHTVGFCLSQKKPLACIVHPPQHESQKSKGNAYLQAEKGAIGLVDSGDVETFIALIAPALPLRAEHGHAGQAVSGLSGTQLSFDYVEV